MDIRCATHADVPLVVGILSEAFADDPFVSWLYPDARRPGLIGRYFGAITRGLFVPHKEIYLAGQEGALLCLPAGVPADGLPMAAFAGLVWRMWWAHGFAGLERARLASDVLKANHPKELHYYLHALGVRTSNRGQGIGTALLRHAAEKCDRRGMPSYLENSNPRNTPLYERAGFRIVGEWKVPNGPPLWFMRREPSGAVS